MKYILEVPDKEVDFAEKFFKKISFIKKIRTVKKNEITNHEILQSIEDYESKSKKPTPLNLKELKEMLNV